MSDEWAQHGASRLMAADAIPMGQLIAVAMDDKVARLRVLRAIRDIGV